MHVVALGVFLYQFTHDLLKLGLVLKVVDGIHNIVALHAKASLLLRDQRNVRVLLFLDFVHERILLIVDVIIVILDPFLEVNLGNMVNIQGFLYLLEGLLSQF